ncbi:hypothetical protein [Nonomuraea sediminis]|uniref:hypothetical protein n=1 Tax=Nonomuraea sediminis TaxID=2835864 RepID=UPI001BDC4909|nr:hypothetical protein [Nonomuraea sediminis]
MTAAALEVAVLVDELMPLLEKLYDLLPEPMGDPTAGTTSHRKAIGSPAPWHAEAGPTLYTISEEARRLEASLRLEVTGRPGRRRGGSDANTVAALHAITDLVHAVPDEHARQAAHIVARWVRQARQVGDVGLEERPRRVPTPPGELPPLCPYCGTWSLRVLPGDGKIWCINGECEDRDGRRPRGHLDRSDVTGDGMISWADGRITKRRDWA